MSNAKAQSSNKTQSSNDKIKVPSPLGTPSCRGLRPGGERVRVRGI